MVTIALIVTDECVTSVEVEVFHTYDTVTKEVNDCNVIDCDVTV